MGRASNGYQLKKFNWSDKWYVCWSEGRKPQRRSTGETDRAEAEKWKATFVLEIGKEQRTGTSLTVNDALDYYLEEHSPNTASHETALLYATHLRQHFGVHAAMEIRPQLVREFHRERAEAGNSTGTTRRMLTVLVAALNHSRKEGRLPVVPHIPLPQAPPPKDRWLTRDEAQRLLAACTTDHIHLFVMLGLFTGQRKGAILDLEWGQVNFVTGLIDFNPPGRVQTTKRRAVVPMNDDLRHALLAAHKQWRFASDLGKIDTQRVITYKGRGDDGRLGDIKKGFSLACDLADLADVTPHTLRHTCGTWLAQGGVDMWRISGILGHSHSRTTELYAKHHPDFMRDAVASLSIVGNLQTITPETAKNGIKRGK